MSDATELVLWYVIRATGATSLLLLTGSLVLGIAATLRWSPRGFPRSVPRTIHRNVGLLAMSFLAVHVLTSVVQAHAKVSLLDVLVPLAGSTHALGLALGTLAIDLLAAIAITSVLRERIGTRTWRLVHFSSYACWPVALAHGLTFGTDAGSAWMLLVDISCVVVVAIALLVRTQPVTAGAQP